MLCSLGLLFVGAMACIFLKDDGREEITYGADESMYYNDTDEDYEQLTFDYFLTLRIDEQEEYFKENLDLRYYMDDVHRGLTNDTYINARHARDIARITGKKYVDKYKTY